MGKLSHAKLFMIYALSFVSVIAHADSFSPLIGHVPTKQISHAKELGRKLSSSSMQLAVSLKLRDPDGLANLVKRLYDPGDILFHQFFTPEELKEAYAPTDSDINEIVQYLASQGLLVTSVHPNNLVIDVQATVGAIENAFHTEIHEYLTADGRIVHAPISEPQLMESIGNRIAGIVGLSDFAMRRPHLHRKALSQMQAPHAQPHAIQDDYMTPSRIQTAYSLNSLTGGSSGETLALYELDGYTASDISAYASYFSITMPTLQNVLVNGFSGSPTPNPGANDDSPSAEVTLDLELAIAIAPTVTKILVYEAPNTDNSIIDLYSRIETDDLANEVSTSWGIPEDELLQSDFTSENSIFSLMAGEGMSVFAAAGDSGAYDDSSSPSTLMVDDPGSEPYVTGVGGTSLRLNNGTTYNSETTWSVPASGSGPNYLPGEGGGGGISSQWPLPSWQLGLSNPANLGSASMRMVPDVSFDADPDTGYSIYYKGTPVYNTAGWEIDGGTSCAAPLWAAYTSMVNKQRRTNGMSRIGWFNPTVYNFANSSLYSTAFHDIADGSNNLHYPAVSGYDLATGWGSFNGAGLFSALTTSSVPPGVPSSLSLTAGILQISLSWSTVSGATSYSIYRSTSASGPFTLVASGLSTTTYLDSSLIYGTYFYYVKAVNATAAGGPSVVESATTEILPPAAPSNLTAQVTQ
jgi:subtilase family serine protease